MSSFSGGRSNGWAWRTHGRRLVETLLVMAVFVACGSAASPMPSGSDAAGPVGLSPAAATDETRPRLQVGRNAWVAVSVATVWRSPDSPREVDAPALTRPVRVTEWLAGMSTSERRSLGHRSDTQALLGDRVRVLALRPGWARVVVPSQPTPLDSRGYPGWVPRRQLTAVHPTASRLRATVLNRAAWLRTDRAHGRRLFQVSFGTRLPVVGETAKAVRVAMPTGVVRRLAKVAVTVHDRRAPALPPTRRSIVRTARSFLGLDYLWAGTSGFGFDCSGLMWLDYRVHGITIPRDALPESRGGTPVSSPRRGDLLFFATDGVVHHVAMYVGRGRMVHSPGTGQSVEVIPLATPEYASEYAGARRYLP